MLKQRAANENSVAPLTTPPQPLPIDRDYLSRWLQAGQPMGLVDCRVMQGRDTDQVVVWVRETSRPAYVIAAEHGRWVVVDAIRDEPLKACRSLEAALAFIRPVLPHKPARRPTPAPSRGEAVPALWPDREGGRR